MSEARVNNLSNESNTGGPTITGITTFSGTNFFVPPVGNTAQRPDNPQKGSIRFNTDSKHLEYYRGGVIGWSEIEASNEEMGGAATSGSIDGKGTRLLFTGGSTPSGSPNSTFNNVDGLTVETLGNTIDFNNLTGSYTGLGNVSDSTRAVAFLGVGPTAYPGPSVINQIQYATFSIQNDFQDFGDLTTTGAHGYGFGDRTRGVRAGNAIPYNGTMDYFTIQSLGDAKDFGDLHTDKGYPSTFSSTTRGIAAGGFHYPVGAYNTIEYWTISSTGNGTDFGDLSSTRYEMADGSNATRGIIAAGYGPGYTNTIEYITIATTGDATDFGDLTSISGTGKYGGTSPTRMIIGGGYNGPSDPFSNIIHYVQIASTGDSTDFGDFQGFGRRGHGSNSNGHGGL